MLVHDFGTVGLSVSEVATEVVADAGGWLQRAATDACEDGARVVRPGAEDEAMAARVTVGPARHRGDVVVIPLVWEMRGHAAPFRRLDADLELADLTMVATHVKLMGHYDPAGARDRWTTHRAVELAVRSFLLRLAGRLETETSGRRR